MGYYDKNKLGELRPNQIISTFGPGSIVDAVKDSVTVLDINYWKEKGMKISDSRLASYLNVDSFYMPKTQGFNDIPVVSFPYMHVCSKCGRIFDIRDNFDESKYLTYGVTCPSCNRQAYPSRFISICKDGHMDDFPWKWWVHYGNTSCNGELKTYSFGSSSSLADMWVECSCGAKRSMQGAMEKKNFIGCKCTGHHPFKLITRNQKCENDISPSQRGASNVYFAVNRSAISIPPWINPLYNLIDEHIRLIESYKDDFGEMGVTKVYEKYFKDKYSRAEFDEALQKRLDNITEFKEIKKMEYEAIIHHDDIKYQSQQNHFKAEEDAVSPEMEKYFSRIIRITRLREVRVLLGFTRLDASDPDAEVEDQTNIVYLNKGNGDDRWLPASEINGEGVFIEFNAETLDKWLNIPEVKQMSELYKGNYKKFCEKKGWKMATQRDATYVLMHTLSHLLIKQMSMSSGYSSSAIRERIYFGDSMHAILLYTGSADKEGSLGGLVELGTEAKIIDMLRDAFQEALLCTNDPECMNNMPNDDSSNGAACHSCCMISETACENGNRMLDRGFIVPVGDRDNQAYFKDLAAELCQLEI